MTNFLLAVIAITLLYPAWKGWRYGRKQWRAVELQRRLMDKYDFQWCIGGAITEHEFHTLLAGSLGLENGLVLNRTGRKMVEKTFPLKADTNDLAHWYVWLDSLVSAPEPHLSATARKWVQANGRKEPQKGTAEGYRRWLKTPAPVVATQRSVVTLE
jgi:hypothetical protein